MMGAAVVPLALGGLALLAGKALIVAKLALVLSAIVGLKKLLSGGGDDHGGVQVVQVPSGGHHRRSLPLPPSPMTGVSGDAAHDMAYAAHRR